VPPRDELVVTAASLQVCTVKLPATAVHERVSVAQSPVTFQRDVTSVTARGSKSDNLSSSVDRMRTDPWKGIVAERGIARIGRQQ